jgi:DNA repair protein RecN (Recombination protein N)
VLRRLRIENLAVVESAVVEFGPGLNVLTGSTGAGKSLIVGAVNLLLGERSSAELIRRGAAEATIEALFVGLTASAHPALAELITSDGMIRVTRSLSRSGRSSATLNDRPATLRELRGVCERLIEPHGQNEQSRLRDPESHASYLDAFAGNENLRADYALALAEWRRARSELARFDADVAGLRQRAGLFAHRLQEIERLAPRAGEKVELEATARVMANAEKIYAALEEACTLLYDDDAAAATRVAQARRRLAAIDAVDGRAGSMAEKLAQAEALIAEAAAEARSIRDGLDFEPADVERVQERLEALTQLERRYRASIEEIMAEQETWRRGLSGLENAEAERGALVQELARQSGALARTGDALTRSRRKAAVDFDRRVSGELDGLLMRGASLRTDVARAPVGVECVAAEGGEVGVLENGLDVVRMRVRTNPGEAEGALETVASTGELSRIALVLKPLAASGGPGATLIFDEIDAGVGADLGDVLAEKLLALARPHQIICITHMAQIAARGHTHLVVVKESDHDRTRVRVSAVAGAERTREIARMLGGREGSAKRLALAEELLAGSRTARGSTRVRP